MEATEMQDSMTIKKLKQNTRGERSKKTKILDRAMEAYKKIEFTDMGSEFK